MHVDLKVTIWGRVELTQEQANQVEEYLKGGRAHEVRDLIDSFNAGFEYLSDTVEELDREDNEDNCTVELFGDNGETIATN